MEIVFTPVEARILGSLVEKEATTPDSYPLSANALRNACNQKTNREPVMDLSEATVQEALDGLVKKTLVAVRSGAGSRVLKYAHRLHDRLRPDFDFSREELALIGVLLLRGPQTPGELRTRGVRIHDFADTDQAIVVLERLAAREDGPYVQVLPRRPGQREVRYAHLFCGPPAESAAPVRRESPAAPVDDAAARIAELEFSVSELRRQLGSLREQFETFRKQFD